jgi:hypothetical protein
MTGREAVVLVSRVGDADGARAAAAALACAASAPDRAGLLVEIGEGRSPRPALFATAAARRLEERLAAHLPEASVAARGQICQVALGAGPEALDRVPAALALGRETACVLHAPPAPAREALEGQAIGADAALLRADLKRDRSLTALAARDLMARGLRVSVLKRALGWVPARRALFGVLPAESADGLPPGLRRRCLDNHAGGA